MNEVTAYMKEHGWEQCGRAGTSYLYTNGELFVFCNGDGWIISKTPNAGERYAKSYKTMLSAFKFADSKKRFGGGGAIPPWNESPMVKSWGSK